MKAVNVYENQRNKNLIFKSPEINTKSNPYLKSLSTALEKNSKILSFKKQKNGVKVTVLPI